MADIAKSGTPSISTVTPCPAHHISGLVAGEAIAAGDMCYVKSDGKVWRSIGTAANAAAKTAGMALQAAAVGEGCSVYSGVNVRYGAGLTPGRGVLHRRRRRRARRRRDDRRDCPVAYAIDATRIRVLESRY
jgi:hypothetical protein